MLALRETDDGVTIKIKATPGASRNRVVGTHGDMLKVAVTVAPEKGKANHAVLAVLAAALDVPPRMLQILSGHASRDKTVLCRGLDAIAVRQRLGVAE